MTATPKSLWQFIGLFIKTFKIEIGIFALVAFIYAVDIVIQPYLIKVIIDRITEFPKVSNYFLLLFWPSCLFIIVALITTLVYRIWDYLYLKIFPEIRASIINYMANYAYSHSYEYFQNNFAGNLANKITNDISSGVEDIIDISINHILPNILILISGLIMLSISHIYFGLTLLFCSLLSFIINLKFSKKVKDASLALAESKSKLMGVVVDSISNSTNIKLFARRSYETTFLNTYINEVTTKDRNFQWLNLYRKLLYDSTSILLTIMLLGLLIYTKQLNLITAGDFALVLNLSMAILSTAHSMAHNYLNLVKAIGICKQALRIIAIPHAIIDKPHAKDLIVTNGKIELKSISFNYKQLTNLFENFSLTIPAHKKIGLVGYSGSGKTTLVNLILRLFEVNSGKILIDNQDISEFTQDSLRNNISFIPQEPMLFHRTLKDNIKYGKLNATTKEVIEAAKKAHAHEFISSLPQRYDSRVGERGIKLSGGQRQRIALARAILKDAPILILDEATSALDSVTETLIQNSLKSLMKGKTVIVVAHRLSTLLAMDKIAVLDKGVIVEEGTHHELKAKNGLYAALWSSQNGGMLP